MPEFALNQLFFVQLLGFVSMAIGWWANTQKQDCKFIHGNMIAAILTAIHLGLLGSFLGMANQLVNVIRFRCCQSMNKQDSTQMSFSSALLSTLFSRLLSRSIMTIAFSTVAIVQGLLWAEHWSEWCAVAAAVVMSFSLFYFAGSQLRLAMLASNGLNLMLSIYLMSWSGMMYQVMTIMILSQGLIQHYLQSKATIETNHAHAELVK
ncbi:YgjV family protein [uncultured Shewanella sp.]|uniref:YgjV family protein n=1 Tax=uncultured Shewanella sp. TaxID=173975 RepID=UPI002632AEA2|nr:YgjV family protein [uncultured Shewanella sp.]